MKSIILLCTCMSFLNIAVGATQEPGEDGPSTKLIKPRKAHVLPAFGVDGIRGVRALLNDKCLLHQGNEVKIRIPGGHTLSGKLEDGDTPNWIHNPQQATTNSNVFVYKPTVFRKSLIANVVDEDPDSPEDPNFKHFEATIMTGENCGYKTELELSRSTGLPETTGIFVRYGDNYEGSLKFFGDD